MSEPENETVREQQPPEEQARSTRPGRRLREAREAKNLSLESMASELRLQTRLVAALEEDDDASLPPPAFVTGYLRSYARRLELPADEIVRAYEQNLEGYQPEIVSRVKENQVSSRDLPVRLVTWLILLGLTALLVVWWLAQQPALEEPVAETGFGTAAPENATMTPEPEPEVQSAPDLHEQDVETVPEPVFVSEPEVSVADASEPEAAPEVQSPAEREPETVAQPEEAGVSLRLEFEADSWTEVTDAEGQRLVYDLTKAGRTVRLTGNPPFRIFLGYAPGVAVYYQGERFDHAPYMRGDIARFRIGSAEDLPVGEG